MKPFIVGVGRAGCRIANLFLGGGSKVPYTGVMIDSDKSDLAYYDYKYKILVGKSLADGNGCGGELQLGREMIEAEKYNIVEKMDSVKSIMDCIFVISGMGGGTGGAVDVLMEELKRSYTEPVYYAGVLPSETEPENITVNFHDSLKSIIEKCDAIFPIDNDMLRENRRLRGQYSHINERLFKYFNSMFEVGEYRSREELGGNILGATDVFNTLTGVSSIGIGSYEIKEEGFFLKRGGKIDKPELVVSLTQKAVSDSLFPLDTADPQKALVLVSGPKKYLDFLGSIPARLWVEKNLGVAEVRGGDMPSTEKKELEVTAVLSGIKKSDRIRYLHSLGGVYKSRGDYSNRLSKAFDKMKIISTKISELEEEVKNIYKDIEHIIKEPNNEVKK